MRHKKFTEAEARRYVKEFGWSKQRLYYWRKRGVLPRDPNTNGSVWIMNRCNLYKLICLYRVNSSDLAAYMGVTEGTIRSWKSGRTNPPMKKALQLRAYFYDLEKKKQKADS